MESYYGDYVTHTFTEVVADSSTEEDPEYWDDVDNFVADFKAAPIYTLTTESSTPLLSDNQIKIIYWLLYANYGNSNIASSDENRFKQRLFTLAIQYAPKAFRCVEIQKSLRMISDEDLIKGSKAIYNTALNPQTTPSTSSLDEITYINQQNTTNYKKSKMDAYAQLWELLKFDVLQDFINKFKQLFITIVAPQRPLLYEEA